jgi:hypothetical protein
MLLQLLGLSAGIVSLIGYPFYIRDIFWGTTRPERASWFIRSLLSLITFFTQYFEGATNSLWLAGAQMVGVLIIFFCSLRKGVGGFTKRDVFGLTVALIGLVMWYLTRHAAIALLLALFVDAVGTALTIPKAYHDPESETLFTWGIDCVAGVLAGLAVGTLNPILLVYPAYIFVSNGATALAIVLGKRRQLTLKSLA